MQRNYSQQLRPQNRVQTVSWVMLILSLAAFVFVANSLYQLGNAFIANQRLIAERERLIEEIERLESLYTNDNGETLYSIYIEDSNEEEIVIRLPLE